MMTKNIIFLTHETSRTGAPLMLLYFMEWIRAQYPTTHMTTLSLKKGSLSESFEQVSDVFCELETLQEPSGNKIISTRIASKFWKSNTRSSLTTFLAKQGVTEVDTIYSNTVGTIPLALKLKQHFQDSKWVAHIHELQVIMQQICPDFNEYRPYIDRFIAASEIVKNNLIQQWLVPNNKVTRVYECSKVKAISKTTKAKEHFIIGGSGEAHWRKGSDLFVQIAMFINRKFPNKKLKFIWVGSVSKNERIILEEDIRKCGLEDVVEFVGATDTPEHYFNEFDVFLMTSREDPFPLVCIEVGMLGKPIITFKNAVGTSEIISNKGGFIVPYLDTNAVVHAITSYIENPSLIEEHGKFNKKAFQEFTPDLICPLLWDIICKI
jgi:glycosyltransferase involved in cell wall biosynthesis